MKVISTIEVCHVEFEEYDFPDLETAQQFIDEMCANLQRSGMELINSDTPVTLTEGDITITYSLKE